VEDPAPSVRETALRSLLGHGWLTPEAARAALERDELEAAETLLLGWDLPSATLAPLLVEVSRFARAHPAARRPIESAYKKRLVDSVAAADFERPLAGYFHWVPYAELSRGMLVWLFEDATRAGQAARALGTVADAERRAVLARRIAPLLFMAEGSLDPGQRLVATSALVTHARATVRAALLHVLAQDEQLLLSVDQQRALEPILSDLAGDAALEPVLRVASLEALEAAPVAVVSAMLSALDPTDGRNAPELELLERLLELIELPARREWVRDLLARAEPSPAFLVEAVDSYVWYDSVMQGAGDLELALVDWVLDRPASNDRLDSVLAYALVPRLATIPGGTAPGRIEGLLRFEDRDTFEATCRVVRAVRDPEHLPALESALSSGLRVDWPPYDNVPAGVAAADTATSYLTDEAAAVLLRGLSSPLQRVREECGRGLEEIQRVRRLRAAFEDEDARVPSREQAVAELFALLAEEDATLRAAAAEGLATLGVLEAVPRLVRLLKDPDPAVSEAARTALSTLRERAPALVAPRDEEDLDAPGAEGDA